LNIKNLDTIQTKLESITRKWWLFLLIIVSQFIPLYTSKGVDLTEIGELTSAILGKDGLVYFYPVVYPIFKIIPIVLVFSIFFLRKRVTRLFSTIASIEKIHDHRKKYTFFNFKIVLLLFLLNFLYDFRTYSKTGVNTINIEKEIEIPYRCSNKYCLIYTAIFSYMYESQ